MADRDALIVICWLVILILVFFECFHRKLKARFGGDIRPPANARQSLSSFPSDSVAVGGPSSPRFGGNFRRGDLLPSTLGNNMSINRGARFSAPITITTSTTSDPGNYGCGSTKEVCRIPMMSLMMSYDSVEEEEPPPTYEEAVSYAKLLSQLQTSPYGDKSVVLQCDDDSVNGDGGNSNFNNNGNGNGVIGTSSGNNHTNATTNVGPTTSTSITTTTAIFVNEEDSEDEDEEESDDSSSSQSANDSDDDDAHGHHDKDSNNNNGDDNSELSDSNRKRVSIISRHEQSAGEVQCNMNVIVTSSSSSKNLDRIEIECSEKIKMSSNNNSEKNNLQFVPPSPSKLLPPSPSSPPGNIV